MPTTTPTKRGCGTRVAGGVYAECGLSPYGDPIEHFLIDASRAEVAALGLTPIGVKLIERNGVYHVFDWIGSEHYPNVADFVEEVRRFGLSRRLPSTLDFSLLSEQSRIILVHARAWLGNATEYFAAIPDWHCPTGNHATHESAGTPPEMCVGLWWHDVEGGATNEPSVVRQMPSFSYRARRAPVDIKDYRPGYVASFPIQALAVIRDRNDAEGVERKRSRAARSGIDVEVLDE